MAKKILSLDDSDEFQMLLKTTLAAVGFDVKTVLTIDSFWLEMKSFKPDLCLVDLNLSEGEGKGFEVIQQIRGVLKETLPIIVLSRVSTEDKISHAIEMGANDFVTKPLDAYFLSTKIKHFLKEEIDSQAFIKVPSGFSKSSFTFKLPLRGVDEYGVYLYSEMYLSKGVSIYVKSTFFEELGIVEPPLMTVTEVKISKEKNYLIYLEFDAESVDLKTRVRNWLLMKNHKVSNGPAA